MSSILIRNVDTALHARLKERAAAHSRSLEEEARVLLRTGLARRDTADHKRDVVTLAQALFGQEHGVALDLPPRDRNQDRAPPDFS